MTTKHLTTFEQHPAVVNAAKTIHNRLANVDSHFEYEPEWEGYFTCIIANAVSLVCRDTAQGIKDRVPAILEDARNLVNDLHPLQI
jgi:hypothetical protein